MRGALLTVLVFGGIVMFGGSPGRAQQTPQTGEFDTTFTEKPPEAEPAAMRTRWGWKPEEGGFEFDLAQYVMRVYVPPNYSAASPPGVLAVMADGPTETVPDVVKSICDASNLIFIASKQSGQYVAEQAVVLLTAAHWLKKQYTLNERRMYLVVGVEDNNHMIYTLPDAYTGFVTTRKTIYYNDVKLIGRPNGEFRPHDTHKPAASIIALAKTRSFVFVIDPTVSDDDVFHLYRKSIPAQMAREGYQHVKTLSASAADTTYPQWSPDWLKAAIQFLDSTQNASGARPLPGKSSSGARTPTSAPASPAAPPAGEADRLLKTAKLYLANGRKDLARAKLRDLIARHPNDPAAALAKKMLDDLGEGE